MNKPELYQKSIDILVQAYFNDTLIHGNCYACAVGNIIAGNMGYGFVPTIDSRLPAHKIVWDVRCGIYSTVGNPNWYGCSAVPEKIPSGVMKEIESTGYTPSELFRIERAFEGVEDGRADEQMFNGLMAVIDVLDQIHGNTDTEVTTTQKNRFTKLVTA